MDEAKIRNRIKRTTVIFLKRSRTAEVTVVHYITGTYKHIILTSRLIIILYPLFASGGGIKPGAFFRTFLTVTLKIKFTNYILTNKVTIVYCFTTNLLVVWFKFHKKVQKRAYDQRISELKHVHIRDFLQWAGSGWGVASTF